jgi:hypothetical protein
MMKKITLLLALLFALPAHAQTIDNLGAGAAVQGTDLFPAYQGVNPAVSVTADQIKTFTGGGTVTSIATDCGVSGGTITTTGTIQGNATTRAASGTTDTILSTDCGKIVTESNGAAVAVTLPQATGSFAAGWFYTQVNLGAGTVTITPTTSTINGAATLVLTTGQSADIISDGTNYIAAKGVGGSTTDASLLTSGTLAAARLPAFSGDCTTSAGSATLSCPVLGFPYRTSSFHVGGAETMFTAASNASTFTANVARCYPGFLRAPGGTVTSIGVRINTTAVSGIDLAVYLNSPTTTRPTGLPLFNTLNLSGAAAAFVSGAVSYAFTQNLQVWFCIVSNNTTVTTNGMTPSLATSGLMGAAANTVLSGTSIVNGITFAQTQNAGWIDLTSPPAFTEIAGATHSAIILGF